MHASSAGWPSQHRIGLRDAVNGHDEQAEEERRRAAVTRSCWNATGRRRRTSSMRVLRSPAGSRRPARRSKQKCWKHIRLLHVHNPEGAAFSMTRADWRSGLDHLAPKQAELLLGTSLSRRFVSLRCG
ncbi:MAG: hypothetical protein CM15mP18_0350 [Methanobacteriota archaeon]|nr:MAG: hypothetical protein CM15mP18_0350 [Euryarchaeota archaeon]